MAALRVGMFTAKHVCCAANSTSTSHTEPTPEAATSHSRIEVKANPELVNSNSLRRSTVSATAPPQSPNTSSGTRPNTPANPT